VAVQRVQPQTDIQTRPWLYNVFNLRQTDRQTPDRGCTTCSTSDRQTSDRGCTTCSTSDRQTHTRPWLYNVFNLRQTDIRPWLYNVFNFRQTDTRPWLYNVFNLRLTYRPDRGCTTCSTSDRHQTVAVQRVQPQTD